MPTADIEIRINTDGEKQFRGVARKFKEYGNPTILNARLRTKLRQNGNPVVAELKAAVLQVHVTSKLDGMGHPHYSRDLRVKVSKAIRLSVAYKGIRFRVQGSLVDPKYGAALAKYLDGELPAYKRWRHPVFGRTDAPWEVQFGQPWFFETVRRHARDFEEGCVQVMNDAMNDIARG